MTSPNYALVLKLDALAKSAKDSEEYFKQAETKRALAKKLGVANFDYWMKWAWNIFGHGNPMPLNGSL